MEGAFDLRSDVLEGHLGVAIDDVKASNSRVTDFNTQRRHLPHIIHLITNGQILLLHDVFAKNMLQPTIHTHNTNRSPSGDGDDNHS